MKKITIILLCLLFILTGYSQGQNIGDIELNFCNNKEETQELDIITKSNQKTDICIKLTNTSDKNVDVNINFVDGIITKKGTKACNPNSQKQFGQYLLEFDPKVTIPAYNSTQKNYQISFPAGFSGLSHGCIMFNVTQKNKEKGGINVIFSKSHRIDMLVGGSKVKSKIKITNINLSGDKQTNDRQISTTIINEGNSKQQIYLSGKIYNIFGYEQRISEISGILDINKKINLKQKTILPNYKGLLIAKLNIKYEPIFNFDIDNKELKHYELGGTISKTQYFFELNTLYTISIIIIILLTLIIIIKRKKKN